MRTAIASATPVDDDFLYALSRTIPGYAFERSADGSLIVAPNHSAGGCKSGEAYYQLRRWMETAHAGGQAFDASAGFRLPDGSLLAADAAWLSDQRIAALAPADRYGYWRVAPEVVIEVASLSDRWSDVCAKSDVYAGAGSSYALAVDGESGATYERGEPPHGLRIDPAAIIHA